MTTLEIAGLIIAFPLLLVIGMFLVPIVLGLIAIAGGAIVFVGGLIAAALSYPICAYNKWRDEQDKKREWNDLLKWRDENPELYKAAQRRTTEQMK